MGTLRFAAPWAAPLVLSCPAFLLPAAQAAPTFADCARQIEQRGFEIYDMEVKGSFYDVDAMKSGRRWDIRADLSCKLINERPD